MQRQVGVHQIARFSADAFLAHELPQLAQVHHIGAQALRPGQSSAAVRTMKPASSSLRSSAGLHRGAQPFALGFILDPGRHPDTADPCGMYTR